MMVEGVEMPWGVVFLAFLSLWGAATLLRGLLDAYGWLYSRYAAWGAQRLRRGLTVLEPEALRPEELEELEELEPVVESYRLQNWASEIRAPAASPVVRGS